MAYWVGDTFVAGFAVFEADSREEAYRVTPEIVPRRKPRYEFIPRGEPRYQLIYGPYTTWDEAQTALVERRDWLGPQREEAPPATCKQCGQLVSEWALRCRQCNKKQLMFYVFNLVRVVLWFLVVTNLLRFAFS